MRLFLVLTRGTGTCIDLKIFPFMFVMLFMVPKFKNATFSSIVCLQSPKGEIAGTPPTFHTRMETHMKKTTASTTLKISLAVATGLVMIMTSDAFAGRLLRSSGSYTRTATIQSSSGNTRPNTNTQSWKTEDGHFSRTATHTGSNGNSVENDVDVVKTENGYQRSRTATGPSGKTRNRTADVSVDPESHTLNRNVTYTDANGNTKTVTNSRQARVENGTYKRTATHTGPNGTTVMNDVGITKTEDGYTKTRHISSSHND
jgi:hypothetical protein